MINARTTVREVAVRYPQTLPLFEEYGIDFCCGGGEPLERAAAQRGVVLAELVARLEQVIAHPPQGDDAYPDWTAASLADLAHHVERRHHTFMREKLPLIQSTLELVANVHGPRHGDVLQPLHATFSALKAEIEEHLRKEEQRLFPALRRVERGETDVAAAAGEVTEFITETAAEHDRVGAALADMRARTCDYALPSDACPTYARLYQELAALEKDLHQHIHLENNIMFPRVEHMLRGPAA